jgi:ankyrin repeat protein
MALETDSVVDTVNFSTLTLHTTGSLAQRRNPLDDKPVLCTICRSPFDTSNLQQLYSHLNDHFRDFNATNRCNECGINFVQKADLDKHRIAAATGHCGFKIHHTKPCTGHHPPGEDHIKVWGRLRHWEQCQLNAYIDQVEQLSSRRLGGSFVQTENNDACRGCRILDFYRRRFPEEYENIYGTHLREHPRFEQGQEVQCCHPEMTKTATEQLLARLTRRRQRRASSSDVNYARYNSTPAQQREIGAVGQTPVAVAEPDPSEILDASYLSNPTQGLLHWAAGAGDSAAIKGLITKGADIHGKDMTGRTAIHWAAASGSCEAVELLLSYRANIELPDNAGQTPIFLGVECGNSAVVELLLEHGADPNAKDTLPRSCLHLAAEAGDAIVIDQLLARGAQVDDVDCFDRTPLHLASKFGHLDAVLALCKAKASVDLQSNAGRTPLCSAVENHKFDIARLLLLHHGASVTDSTMSKAIERGADEELLELMRSRIAPTDSKYDSF